MQTFKPTVGAQVVGIFRLNRRPVRSVVVVVVQSKRPVTLGKRVRRCGEFEFLRSGVPPPFVGGGPGHDAGSRRAYAYCDLSGPWRKGTMQAFYLARTRRLRLLEPDFGFQPDSSSSACRAIPLFTCPAFFLSAASRS
jgi:hypothetical protein